MKKLFIVAIVVLLIAGGVYLINKKEAKAPAEGNQQNQNQNAAQSPAQSQNNQPASSTPSIQTNVKGSNGPDYTPPGQTGENAGSNIQVYEVDFDGTAYSPAAIKISINDWVFFKNKSSADFWPAAGSANTIAAFPNFNPSAAIAPGKEYKFQFTKAGSWSFGDNLHANMVFTVNVSQ
jgi:plastocyanin